MSTDTSPPQVPIRRRRWAIPAVLVGVACSLVVAWLAIDYAAKVAAGEGGSVSFVYTLRMAPFLSIGVPSLVIGAVGVARPWAGRRPWLPRVAGIAAVVWYLAVLQGPMLIAPDTTSRGTATVEGLPGQRAPWTGEVECTRAGDAVTSVKARVPAEDAGTAITFAVDVSVGPGFASMIVGDAAAGGGSWVSADRIEADDDRSSGTVSAALDRDAPSSTIIVTWVCPTPP